MARTKRLINYAHLNDKHGDLSQCWFVEYSFMLPGSDEKYRKRLYDGLGTGTADERRAIAASMISAINGYLKSGEYLNHDADYTPVELSSGWRPEQQRFMEKLEERAVRNVADGFLEYKKSTLRPKPIQDYRSKLKEFVEYVEDLLDGKRIDKIEQPDIVEYLSHLATDRGLCRNTIKKSKQVLSLMFDYAELKRLRPERTNPVYNIPAMGQVVDCSPEVYSSDERQRLKMAIETREPFLWLACEIIYYCAVRPGTELRLLQIKHINPKARTITIPADLAKNKKREAVRIPEVLLRQMIQLNIFQYDPELYLFGRHGTPSETPMGKNTMRNRFNQYRDALGISSDHKFYSWKHTGAISAASNGADAFKLRDHLRHRSVSTTEKYLKKWVPNNDTSEKFIDEI